MRALVQRAIRGEVRVGSETVGAIGQGLVILLGVGPDDTERGADDLARKIAELRIFMDPEGRTNRSLLDTGGAALVVSQFTLYADTRRGRRPGFTTAGPPSSPSACSTALSNRCAPWGSASRPAGSAPRWRSSW